MRVYQEGNERWIRTRAGRRGGRRGEASHARTAGTACAFLALLLLSVVAACTGGDGLSMSTDVTPPRERVSTSPPATPSPPITCEAAVSEPMLPGMTSEARAAWAWSQRDACPETAAQVIRAALPGLPVAARGDARTQLGILLGFKLDPPRVDQAHLELEAASTEAQAAGDACTWIRARKTRVELLLRASALDAARDILAGARDAVDRCADASRQAAFLHQEYELARREGRFVDGWRALEQARERLERAGQDALFYELKQAELQHDLGDVSDEGLAYQDLLLRAQQTGSPQEPNIRLDLAYLYRDLGDLEAASATLQPLIDGMATRPDRHSAGARARLLLAWTALDAGDPDRAGKLLAQAPLEAFTWSENRHLWMFVEGTRRLELGQLREADAWFQRILGDEPVPEAAWRARLGLARVARARHDTRRALALLWESVTQLEREHREASDAFWSLAYLSQRHGLYELWLDVLIDAWIEGGRRGRSAAGDRWQTDRAFGGGAVTADDLLAAVEKVCARGLNVDLYRDQGGIAGLVASSAASAQLRGSEDWISGAELRAFMLPALPVLVYQPLPERVLLLEVWSTGVKVHLLPVSRQALVAQVRSLEASLERSPVASPPELDVLGRMLLTPVAGALPTDQRPVGFVLQPPLARVPMAALRLGGRFLVERVSPFELPDLAALKVREPPQQAVSPLRAFGVSFGPDLERAASEVSLLKRRGLEATLLTGREAGRQAVIQAVAGKDLIHFATHALPPRLEPSTPFRQLLRRLRQAQLSLADGALTASDLRGLPIRAKLVVLSGCDTYVGRPIPLESGFGALHRAVLAAGAEAAIASRWAVGDEATYALMRGFYDRLLQEGRAVALAGAQRAMLSSAGVARGVVRKHVTIAVPDGLHPAPDALDIPYAAPWSWAAFTVVGQWN